MTWARVNEAFEPSTWSRIVVSGRGAGGGADETPAAGGVLKPQAHHGSCIVAAARAPATAILSAVTAKSARAAALKNVCGVMMMLSLVARGVANTVYLCVVQYAEEHHALNLTRRIKVRRDPQAR
jgi:hypothetical protein